MLGYTSRGNSHLGFFIEKCWVSNADSPSTKLYLIGSEDNSLNENCLLDRTLLDIGQKMRYVDESGYSKSEFNLEFLAFRFPTSGNLTVSCDVRICLETNCPTESVSIC